MGGSDAVYLTTKTWLKGNRPSRSVLLVLLVGDTLLRDGSVIETDMPACDADGPHQHHVSLTHRVAVSPEHDRGATTVWARRRGLGHDGGFLLVALTTLFASSVPLGRACTRKIAQYLDVALALRYCRRYLWSLCEPVGCVHSAR